MYALRDGKIHDPLQGMLLSLNNENKSESRNKDVSTKSRIEKGAEKKRNQRNIVRSDISMIKIYISLLQ